MKLVLKIQLQKFCFAVFNSFFLVLGLCVFGCAAWILFDQGNFLTILSSTELRTVALGLLVIGGVVTTVSVTGCVGADREHRSLLLIYLGFLIILVLGQVFVSLVLLLNRNKIEQSLDGAVDQVVLEYGGSSRRADALMDNMQYYGECCGRKGHADWQHNSYIQNLTSPEVLPCSCFKYSQPSFNSSWCCALPNCTEPLFGPGNDLFVQGCGQKLNAWLRENELTILALDVGLILIQVIQFVLTVYLYLAFGEKASMKRPDHTPSEHLNARGLNHTYAGPD